MLTAALIQFATILTIAAIAIITIAMQPASLLTLLHFMRCVLLLVLQLMFSLALVDFGSTPRAPMRLQIQPLKLQASSRLKPRQPSGQAKLPQAEAAK